ncbi:MAG TPA: hypothetical protein VI504_00180 [Candidatus Eisenbacteria bacterium]|jgi:hypothetical protein
MSRSKEVETAVGPEGETLKQRRAELARIIAAPSERDLAAQELAAIDAQMAAAAEARGREKAEKRMVGIKAAWGGLTAARRDAVKRVQKQREELAAAIGTLNKQIAGQDSLRQEAEALVDRFSIALPSLKSERPELELDLNLPLVTEHQPFRRPATEKCEHGLRERRTYAELAGTETAEIISAAGLKPWAPLTRRQQESVAALAEGEHENKQRHARQADLLSGEIARLDPTRAGLT